MNKENADNRNETGNSRAVTGRGIITHWEEFQFWFWKVSYKMWGALWEKSRKRKY